MRLLTCTVYCTQYREIAWDKAIYHTRPLPFIAVRVLRPCCAHLHTAISMCPPARCITAHYQWSVLFLKPFLCDKMCLKAFKAVGESLPPYNAHIATQKGPQPTVLFSIPEVRSFGVVPPGMGFAHGLRSACVLLLTSGDRSAVVHWFGLPPQFSLGAVRI